MNNVVILVGNLGRDPELRTSSSGTPVCNLPMAVDRHYSKTNTDGSREAVKTTDWITATAWGPKAEQAATWLKKGSLIGVRGSLRPRQYEDQDGKTQYTMDIRVDDIEFLGGIRSKEEVAATKVVATQPSA